MQVILLSDRLGPARTFSFSLRHVAIVAAVLLTTLIWSGFIGFRYASDEGGSVAITLGKRQTQPQVEQLAQRVGELQARLARLDAIGERVAAKSGVRLPDLNQPEPGRGGPLLAPGAAPINATDLANQLDLLTRGLELASDQLQVLDADLLLRQASQGKLPMDRPVAESAYVSSVFGIRTDPFTGLRARHEGIDFADELGTPILAAESGVVLSVNNHPQYGNSLEIDHGKGLVTRYGHTAKVLVKQGDLVKRGQPVAEMGSTGRSTGPHLHFEVIKAGLQQNPIDYLSGRS